MRVLVQVKCKTHKNGIKISQKKHYDLHTSIHYLTKFQQILVKYLVWYDYWTDVYPKYTFKEGFKSWFSCNSSYHYQMDNKHFVANNYRWTIRNIFATSRWMERLISIKMLRILAFEKMKKILWICWNGRWSCNRS